MSGGNFHTQENESHVYHHSDSDGARVNVSFEKNSKGYNYAATVTGASSVEEAMKLLVEVETSLRNKFAVNEE